MQDIGKLHVASRQNTPRVKLTRSVHTQAITHCRQWVFVEKLRRMISWKGARSETLVEDTHGFQTGTQIPLPFLREPGPGSNNIVFDFEPKI